MNIRRYLIPLVMLFVILAQFIPAVGAAPRSAAAVTRCDWAQFVADVTVPDGATYAPGATFVKTWRLKNIGTCTWTTAYSLVFVSGDKLGAPSAVNLPSNVAPGGTVDVSVNMTAPSAGGHYVGYWQLRNASSVLFGIGTYATGKFWVEINVVSTAGTVLDFVTDYCSATWTSGAGALPCPGTDGDAKGFVIKKDSPQLENGSTDTNPGLLVVPQNVAGGYIQGIYPAFTVQSGDRFQSIVNCSYNAPNCYVTFRLDYQIGTGTVKTFWTFRERYEGLFYRVNLNLSSLAGQSVKFILYVADVSGRGVPTGDRAMWGGARIVRGVTPNTPTPTATSAGPTPTPTATSTSTCTNRASFIGDVTVPDGTNFVGNTAFTKTWRLKNVGTCTWTTAYNVYFANGDQMGAPASVNMPSSVAPNGTVDVSVAMTAPATIGHYKGYWKLHNNTGGSFGIGATYTTAFWVDINVTTGATGTVYDFVTEYCSATWTSGAGALACPGTDGDAKGFVLKLASPKLESGATASQPGLLTFPQNVSNGWIQGIYPAFAVKSGDHFQAIVNCEYGATGCYVTFRLDYQIGTGTVKTFWSFTEKIEGLYKSVNLDLSSLAGQSVKFILTVSAAGSATGDRAVWVAPRIVR